MKLKSIFRSILPQKVKSACKSQLIKIIKSTISSETWHFAAYIPYLSKSDSYVISKAVSDLTTLDNFGLPIPPTNLWVGYGRTDDEYLASGQRHFSKMCSILDESGFAFKDGDRILDFGCAAGRIIRQFNELASKYEIWGVDIHAERIVWCKQHLSPPFRFATTTLFPHLPFEDNYFNLIYAGSVFTHIDDLADSWLLELRRVLRPGGRLYITIHDNNTIDIVVNKRPQDVSLSQYEFSRESGQFIKSDFAMFTIDRLNGPHVFYDIDYFCQSVKSFYKINSVTKEAYGYQTALLLQKP